MFLAHIEHPQTYRALLTQPVWQEVFTLIDSLETSTPEGKRDIRGRDIYINVQRAQTLLREKGVYEAHREYIDLHYCLEGGEVIEWAPVATLTPHTTYNSEKDYALFEAPQQSTSCIMTPGAFAIFLPADAHMPKISDGVHEYVKKVVVKIRYNVLQ